MLVSYISGLTPFVSSPMPNRCKDTMANNIRRPPQGDVDNRVRLIAQGLNMTNYIWNEETDDWRAQAPGSPVTTQDVDNNYQDIVNNAKNASYTTQGGIILTHQSSTYLQHFSFLSLFPCLRRAMLTAQRSLTLAQPTTPWKPL